MKKTQTNVMNTGSPAKYIFMVFKWRTVPIGYTLTNPGGTNDFEKDRFYCSFGVTETFGECEYALQGIVNHLGMKTNHGHYVSYVIDRVSKDFWEVDDTKIKGPEHIRRVPGFVNNRKTRKKSTFYNQWGTAYMLIYSLKE